MGKGALQICYICAVEAFRVWDPLHVDHSVLLIARLGRY